MSIRVTGLDRVRAEAKRVVARASDKGMQALVNRRARSRARIDRAFGVLHLESPFDAADLRRWTADARRHRRTPTLAYFRARAQAETLAELRSAAIRQFVARTNEDIDRVLLYGFAGVEATYEPRPIRVRDTVAEMRQDVLLYGEGWLRVKRP